MIRQLNTDKKFLVKGKLTKLVALAHRIFAKEMPTILNELFPAKSQTSRKTNLSINPV